MTPAPHPAPPPVSHRRSSLVEQELVNSLGWLISIRWLAGSSVLLGTLIATQALRVPLPAGPLYAIGLAILLYNAALMWVLRWLRRADPDDTVASEWFARIQIGLDWVAMTALIVHSGGAESPAIIFFLFHITIASLLLPHHHGFLSVPDKGGFVGQDSYYGLVVAARSGAAIAVALGPPSEQSGLDMVTRLLKQS